MKRKNFIAAALSLCLVFGLIGCGQAEPKALVTVNGVAITESDLDQYMPFFMSMMGGTMEYATDAFREQALEDLVTMEVLKQYYEDQKDEVLPATLEEDFKQYESQIEGDESSKQFLTENKISKEFLKKFYTDQNYMIYFFTGLQEEVLAKEDEAKKIYEDNKEDYFEIKASHVLVPLTGSALAGEVLKKAKAGEDFAKLSDEYSIDETAKQSGGDLGYFRDGDMVQAFWDAAFSMKVGEIKGPVETEYGYHIIKVEDKRYAPFEELFSENGEIYYTLFEELYQERLDEIKKDMTIEYLTETESESEPENEKDE